MPGMEAVIVASIVLAGVAVALLLLVRRTPVRPVDAAELRALRDQVGRLHEAVARSSGALQAQLASHGEQTAVLNATAGALREVLASPKARGQWGERMADDVLRVAGLVEGVSYVKQRATRHGTIPDVTFLLPGGRVLHMDVKFPIASFVRSLEASSDAERDAHRTAFLRDVRARVRELTGRGYVDPAGGTLDYVLLFLPNEAIYSFVHEHDRALLDDALRQKVVLCSPLTLYAVLAVVRQAAETAALERTSGEVLAALGAFTQEWGRFCESLDKVGRTVDAVERAYGELAGTRRRALERPLARVDELRRTREP
ncbi:MAG: recombination protein RmuC, partial [Actinomycetota bacterium]